MTEETQFIYETVLNLQPRVSGSQGGGAKSPEELVDDMAAQFQEEMPELMDREKVG
jgi:hypothetical protein